MSAPEVGSAVPLFCTARSLAEAREDVLEAQRRVVESGRYILGPEVEAFEGEFAAFVGAERCVGVASGTDALTIALRALGVGPGDEVVIPALTFFATAEAVVHAGATPVFADIDPETFCLNAATAEPAIGPRTRAIVPVHLFGNPAPMGELAALADTRELALLEDAAQAVGARLDGTPVGSLGRAAAFSFYPGKNLGAFGDAGAIVGDDAAITEHSRLLRVHGQGEPWVHHEVGYTSRLDAIQAAALRVLLPRLGGWTDARRRAAAAYEEAGLAELVPTQRATPGAEPAHHLRVVLVADRDRVIARLADDGIEARAYYTTPMHRQPALATHAPAGISLPAAERLAAEGLALPIGPDLEPEQAERVVASLRSAVA